MIRRLTHAVFSATNCGARVAAGFASQEALAAKLNLDRTVITKSESGERPPSPEVLGAWCTECKISDPELYSRLTALARSADGPIPRWFEDWLAAEIVAQMVRDWAPIIIPALFHTAAYARELLLKAQTDVSDEHINALVDAKLQRQANVLGRADPPDLVAVIDEPALRRLVGSPTIMYEQLAEVANLATRPYITVQVIPGDNGANACLSGPLSIATGDGVPDPQGSYRL